MSDNLDMTPHLTLTPEADAAAAAAPAAPGKLVLRSPPGLGIIPIYKGRVSAGVDAGGARNPKAGE